MSIITRWLERRVQKNTQKEIEELNLADAKKKAFEQKQDKMRIRIKEIGVGMTAMGFVVGTCYSCDDNVKTATYYATHQAGVFRITVFEKGGHTIEKL